MIAKARERRKSRDERGVVYNSRIAVKGAKIAYFFFERAIFDEFWSSTAPALRFLAVSRLFWRPPAHFGDLELMGSKKRASLKVIM